MIWQVSLFQMDASRLHRAPRPSAAARGRNSCRSESIAKTFPPHLPTRTNLSLPTRKITVDHGAPARALAQ